MGVPKSRRSQSSVDFEMIYFRLADGIDTLVEHQFFAEALLIEKNKVFIEMRSRQLEHLTDELLYYIKIANSIYPQDLSELSERRLAQDKAVGVCYAILTTLQRIMTRLRIEGNRYVPDVKNIEHLINSLKRWRKSDGKLKATISKKEAQTGK